MIMMRFCRWGVLHWWLEVVSMQVHGHPRGPADVSAHLRRPHGPGPGQLPLWVEIPQQRAAGLSDQIRQERRDRVQLLGAAAGE